MALIIPGFTIFFKFQAAEKCIYNPLLASRFLLGMFPNQPFFAHTELFQHFI